jgi:hypothetical protein
MAVSYTVSFGRRWSLLEHLLLVEVANGRRSVRDLSHISGVPERLVIEALINLMRASWVEVRSTDAGVFFTATGAGRRRANEENLPVTLQRDVKWLSVCVDRLTGAWLRADELDLVYERDLPEDPECLDPILHTYNPDDPSLRDLFYLNLDESLEPSAPQFRNPSKPYARIGVAFGALETGLPPSAPLRLKEALITAAEGAPEAITKAGRSFATAASGGLRDDIQEDDLIVGGAEHFEMLKSILDSAKSHVIIHSCFVNPATIKVLAPYLERAARRKVQIELLWGLHVDPEEPARRKPISDSEAILAALPPSIRSRVQLAPHSSGSHAKIIIYNDRETDRWLSIVGSCNYLSTEFDWVDASVRSRNQQLATQLLGRLIAAQLPASGSWSPVAKRLNRLWTDLRHKTQGIEEEGCCSLTLMEDNDHYACVTRARDVARKQITIGCDLYGLSAETSVLVPMARAAELGCKVSLAYNRLSRRLSDEGLGPDRAEIEARGINIEEVTRFHAKFLSWDEESLAITSFNWLATVVDGSRARGAEFGLLIEGDGMTKIFMEKMLKSMQGRDIPSFLKLFQSQ